MRIPRVHDLTLGYCELFGLPLRPFVMGNPKGLVHIGGQRMTAEEANADPTRLRFAARRPRAGPQRRRALGGGHGELGAMVETRRRRRLGRDRPRVRPVLALRVPAHEGLVRGRHRVLRRHELRRGGHAQRGRRDPARGPRQGATSTCRRSSAAWTGCRTRSTASSSRRCGSGAEVLAIDQDPTVGDGPLQDRGGPLPDPRRLRDLHGAVLGAARRSRSSTPFSREKQRAIRQLNYHASTKILFQVRERIWESDDGILGGATVTDLPIRRMNYPTPDPTTSRGVLLASYTWGQDALQWGAMDDETRLEEALDDVARIHPRIREVYEVGASHAWYGDRWARGAFAMFAPEQQTELQADIVRPEGRDPVRRRALLAVPRLDPGRARVGHPRRARRSTRRRTWPRGRASLWEVLPRRASAGLLAQAQGPPDIDPDPRLVADDPRLVARWDVEGVARTELEGQSILELHAKSARDDSTDVVQSATFGPGKRAYIDGPAPAPARMSIRQIGTSPISTTSTRPRPAGRTQFGCSNVRLRRSGITTPLATDRHRSSAPIGTLPDSRQADARQSSRALRPGDRALWSPIHAWWSPIHA